MKKSILITLIAASAIAPVAAQAETYVGGNWGRGEQTLSIDGVGSVKDNGVVFKLYGGYQFNANFGIEGGYADLGKGIVIADGDRISSNPKSFYVAATGALPLSGGFALTGKVGVARHRTRVEVLGFADEVMKKTVPLVGIGATYAMSPTVQAVLEFEHFGKVIDEDDGHLKATALTVGMRFKF
ncbi:MAG: outer membrane beta-barrel protein [Pseudomonadota bacterium]